MIGSYFTQALSCIAPCIIPALSLVGAVITIRIIRYRLIYLGSMPSDGRVDGFPSAAAKIEYFDTKAQRFRETVKALIIWFIIAIVGSLILWFFNTYSLNLSA